MHTPSGPDAANAADLAALVRDGVLDPELASLVWILVEARTPLLVVGPVDAARDAVIDALRLLVPAGDDVVPVTGDDDFERIPEAVELGWRRERPMTPVAPERLMAATTVLVARDLGDAAAGGPAGERARVVVRALSLGYGLLATMSGTGIDDVLNGLADPSIGTDEDERSRLGMIVALAPDADAAPGSRVVAAHCMRPTARDQHGHVQRFAPAVLATWNPSTGRYDHFAWGVLPELAARLGVRPIELEREQARRAASLRRLPTAGRD